MNGGVSGKEEVICAAFDFKDPLKECRSEVFGDHGKLDGSNNPQTFESDPLKHGSNGLGYKFNDYSQTTDNKLSASDQEEGDGHYSGISSDDNPFLKDSLFMKLKISLTQSG